MKKAVLGILVGVCLLFTGCDLWMSGQYQSVTPHQSQSSVSGSTDQEVSSYLQLRDRLYQLVCQGEENSVIYYSTIDSTRIDTYMNTAVGYVTKSTPIGAYAVEEITFESGTNSGKPAVAVTITYARGRSQLQYIQKASTMEQVCICLEEALTELDSELTLQVEQYQELDIPQYIRDFVDSNPSVCMEQPQVTVAAYPQQGSNRILEIRLNYQTSREDLLQMRQQVEPVFAQAQEALDKTKPPLEQYEQLYYFLMDRNIYKLDTAITPAYHLLCHGVGDSKAFATVYGAMCRQAGLDCQLVSGTKDAQSRYWNCFIMDGSTWFVDLLACSESGGFSVKTREEMTGYVWDYDRYEPAEQTDRQ